MNILALLLAFASKLSGVLKNHWHVIATAVCVCITMASEPYSGLQEVAHLATVAFAAISMYSYLKQVLEILREH